MAGDERKRYLATIHHSADLSVVVERLHFLCIHLYDGGMIASTIEELNWLRSVFALMAFSSVVVALLSMRLQPKERTFHLFNVAIVTTASIAYFCMASDLGTAPVEVYQRGPGARQFWYVRYIDWVITTPLLLTELLLIGGLPLNIILSSIFADEVMVICDVSKVTSGFECFLLTFAPGQQCLSFENSEVLKLLKFLPLLFLMHPQTTYVTWIWWNYWNPWTIETIEILEIIELLISLELLKSLNYWNSWNPWTIDILGILELSIFLERLKSSNYWYSWNPWTIDILGIIELLTFLESLNYWYSWNHWTIDILGIVELLTFLELLKSSNYWYSWNPWTIDILGIIELLIFLESLNYWYSWNPWTIDILGIIELLIFLESLNY